MSFDPQTPNLARMYDYMLGGKDNLAVDREAMDQLTAVIPQAVPLARANRAFLQRSVRHLAARGVGQFLDLGSGLPTMGNVHEIAHEAKVVYVDHDPVVAAHARAMLEEPGRVVFVQGDLLDPDDLLARPEVVGLLDLTKPVAVLLVSILHFVQDSSDPQSKVARLREALAPGSYLVLTHGVSRGMDEAEEAAKQVYKGSSTRGATDRTREEILAFFGDFELVEPGLVPVTEWHPDTPQLIGEDPLPTYLLGGMAAKPSGQ